MSYDKIKVRDYNPDAPPGKYAHVGLYCWLCGEQTSHFRRYKTSEALTCTQCGALEGFGPADLDEAVWVTWGKLFQLVNSKGTLEPELLEKDWVGEIVKWAGLLRLLINKKHAGAAASDSPTVPEEQG